MKFLRILAITFTASLLWFTPAFSDTVIITVRHGEKSEDGLNTAGRARALALVEALAGTTIEAIYAPEYNRNRETAAPLAAERGLDVTIIPDYKVSARLLDGNENRTILWVGNKPNLKAIWKDLGVEGEPPLAYGDLFILTLKSSGPPSVERLHFGE